MKWTVEEYLAHPRNTNLDNLLKKELRNASDEDRERFVWELIEKSGSYGLSFAKSTCRRKNFFLKVLHKGFLEGNASSIKYWLDCTIPKLGFKRVMKEVECVTRNNNKLLSILIYWLPEYIENQNEKSLYLDLYELAKSRKAI